MPYLLVPAGGELSLWCYQLMRFRSLGDWVFSRYIAAKLLSTFIGYLFMPQSCFKFTTLNYSAVNACIHCFAAEFTFTGTIMLIFASPDISPEKKVHVLNWSSVIFLGCKLSHSFLTAPAYDNFLFWLFGHFVSIVPSPLQRDTCTFLILI